MDEYLSFIDSAKNEIELLGTKYKVSINYTVLVERLPKDQITTYLNFAKIKQEKISFLTDVIKHKDLEND